MEKHIQAVIRLPKRLQQTHVIQAFAFNYFQLLDVDMLLDWRLEMDSFMKKVEEDDREQIICEIEATDFLLGLLD
jgi:hypothetical protein